MRSDRRHLVTLTTLGVPVPDGEGGYTQPPVPLDPPTWWCTITPASARELERLTAGTSLTAASHIVEGDYHAGITTSTQITFEARIFYVNGVVNPEERDLTTIAFCSEVVPT